MTRQTRSLSFLPIVLALFTACAGADGPTAPGASGRVASVAVGPAGVVLDVGDSAILTATPLDEAGAALHGRAIAWTSSDTTVAVVSPEGTVTARRVGATTVRASSEGKSGAVTVTVRDRAVAWIQIIPAGGLIPQALGTSRQLGVVAHAQDGSEILGRPVSWSSSDAAVASVSASGLLEAHAAGTATITAVVDGKRDSTTVSVPTLIARIETNPAELALGVMDEATIAATAFDASGSVLSRAFAWSTSNSAVATVDASGRVVAKGAGIALITVTSEGRSAATRVAVRGTLLRMTDAAGSALPAILYTTTTVVDGVEREARFQATGGTIRIVDERYELRIEGWLLVDGEAPVPATRTSGGVVAYDVFTGAPLFFEGDDWVNQDARFRSRFRDNGALELDWNRNPGEAIVPLGFTR